jgi:diadenosine tetraphosphate (Ap4A) HIT family hydrolase
MNQTPQVHFHLIPRYKGRREFAGGTFVDPEFGGHYGIGSARTLDIEAYEAVIAELKRRF